MKSGPLYADVRANAEAAAARAPSGPSIPAPPPPPAADEEDAMHAAWIFQFDADSDTVPRQPKSVSVANVPAVCTRECNPEITETDV